jgi:hypothetical protein
VRVPPSSHLDMNLESLLRTVSTDLKRLREQVVNLEKDEAALLRAIQVRDSIGHQQRGSVNDEKIKLMRKDRDQEKVERVVAALRALPGHEAHLNQLVEMTKISKTTLKIWGRAYEDRVGSKCPWTHGATWSVFKLKSINQAGSPLSDATSS